MRQLLSDVAVVEVSTEPAGSYCAKVFADLGADVVKVEPPSGDPQRGHPERFVHLNTNKRAIALRDDESGREQLRELLGSADVLVESQGVGDLQGFGVFTRRVARAASLVGRRDHQRLRYHRPVRLVPVVGPGGAGRVVGRPSRRVDRSRCRSRPHGSSPSARSATRLHSARWPESARARHSGVGRAHRLRGLRGARCHPRSRAPVPRLGVRGTRAAAARGQRRRHLAPHRRLPVCRRLRLDDVDTAAARRDALGAGRRHAPRGVRPSRHVREPGDQGDPGLRAVPVVVRAHRAEGTAAAEAAGWPFAGVYSPAEVLEADHLHQRGFWTECDDPTIGPVLLPGPPYRHAEGGWQRHRPAPVAPTSGDDAAAVPRRARPETARIARPIPRPHRCRVSGSSTSPRCGRVRTSPSCWPISAPR